MTPEREAQMREMFEAGWPGRSERAQHDYERYAHPVVDMQWEGALFGFRHATEWNPIETAPRGKEVLVWRADSGAFIAKLVTPEEVISVEEMEREKLEFPDDFLEWFSDAYGWQESAERPTHWMPLPEQPKASAQP